MGHPTVGRSARGFAVVLLVVTTFGASAGCEGNRQVSPPRDPCGLVSIEQAQRILEVAPLTRTPDVDDPATCAYASDRAQARPSTASRASNEELAEVLGARASLQLVGYPSDTDATRAYASTAAEWHAHLVQTVRLGDAAACAPTFVNFVRLTARVGRWVLSVTAPSCESATALASIAVGELRRER